MSLKTGWIEKRWHERKKATWDVTYQVIGSEEAVSLCRECHSSISSVLEREQDSKIHAITHDFAVSGLAVIGNQTFHTGTKLLLYIHHPSRRPSLVMVAEVVHSAAEPFSSDHLYRSGMKILGVQEETFHRILFEL
ncbi:MAG TPA: PilZ domain-containing protein [bacterium]|nr:PilZ domain-containing protein [bacterium]